MLSGCLPIARTACEQGRSWKLGWLVDGRKHGRRGGWLPRSSWRLWSAAQLLGCSCDGMRSDRGAQGSLPANPTRCSGSPLLPGAHCTAHSAPGRMRRTMCVHSGPPPALWGIRHRRRSPRHDASACRFNDRSCTQTAALWIGPSVDHVCGMGLGQDPASFARCGAPACPSTHLPASPLAAAACLRPKQCTPLLEIIRWHTYAAHDCKRGLLHSSGRSASCAGEPAPSGGCPCGCRPLGDVSLGDGGAIPSASWLEPTLHSRRPRAGIDQASQTYSLPE